ncbi:MAG: hypothetical protein Q4F54_01780 [Coriobacteriia bacterium]|nr:hypothetical protein [Coriobacteriia bacterium]
MADAGDTKDVEFKKGLVTETLHYRIIGICHDLKSDGKPAGLTFAPVNTLPISYAYGNANQDYAVNWKSSSIREKLQENGEIFKCFPKELTDKITNVKKKYALAFGDDDD